MDAKMDTDPGVMNKRVNVPVGLLDLLDEVAIVMNATPKWVLNMLMVRIENLAVIQPEVLGFEFERARRRLDAKGRFAEGFGAPAIDDSLLHRSDKSKSGYVGVYVNGKGFSAMAPSVIKGVAGAQISLGTFPTATQAAEARRLHFVKHGLPYGRLAEHLETFKHSDVWKNADPELKRRYAIWELAQAGTPAEGLSEEDRKWETTDPLGHVE